MGVKVLDDGYKWLKKLCGGDETCVLLVLVGVVFAICMLFQSDGFMGGAPLNWNDHLSEYLDLGILNKLFGFGPYTVPRTVSELMGGHHEGMTDYAGHAGHAGHDIVDDIVDDAETMIGLHPKLKRQDSPPSLKGYLGEMGAASHQNFGQAMQKQGSLVMGSEVESYGGWSPGYAPVEVEFEGAMSFDAHRKLEHSDIPAGSMSAQAGSHGVSEGQGGKGVVTLYFAEWCPHSQNVKPHWDKLSQKHADKFHFELVDSEDKDKLKQADPPVEGFPDVRFNGKPLEFAERTLEGMEKALGL